MTGAPVGFAGPVGLRIPIYCDLEVCAMSDFVVGANAADAHLTGVCLERDFTPTARIEYGMWDVGRLLTSIHDCGGDRVGWAAGVGLAGCVVGLVDR